MKLKRLLILSSAVFIFGGCMQKKESSIEGTWKLVKMSWWDDSTKLNSPGDFKITQLKTWTKEYFTFVGHYDMDTTSEDNYGSGSYKLDGDKYEENLEILSNPENVKQVRLLLEIKGDTLTQKWPADENWKLAEHHNTEQYVRVK